MRKTPLLIAIFWPLCVFAGTPKEISGIYPSLAMFNAEGECGTGAVVPWAGSFWVITYAPHAPYGSSNKLYENTAALQQIIRPEIVGGNSRVSAVLWQLGKPRGKGGPWMIIQVRAGIPSDPFLMTGFDRKRFDLSNEGDKETTITLEADVTGDGHWALVKNFQLKPGEALQHDFPAWFQACWIRLVSSNDTTASTQFTYE